MWFYAVRALNTARLEANIRVYGEQKHGKKWPQPYTIACGVLVLISTFKYIYHPLVWVGLGAVALGSPPILLRSWVSARNCTLDVNILVLIAGLSLSLSQHIPKHFHVYLYHFSIKVEVPFASKQLMEC